MWENKTTYAHAELSGLVDRSGEAARQLSNSGLSPDSVRSVLDGVTQGQSVMLATNDILWIVALVFAAGACLILLAPRPKHAVDMTRVGH